MQNPPKIKPISELIIPNTLLMGAGPTPLPAVVAEASSQMINHLGKPMNQILLNIQEMSRYLFQTKNQYIFCVGGPASAAMEMSLANTLQKGSKVLCLISGTFSHRFVEMSEGLGAVVTEIKAEVGKQLPYQKIIEKIEKEDFDVITMVHGESSTGVKNKDISLILKKAKEKGILTIVDAVCTVSSMEFLQDEWEIDIVFIAGQKGLSSVPGASLISISDFAYEKSLELKGPKPHWCYNFQRAANFWIRNQYHYTAPVTNLMALHESLRLICEETLEKRFERHINHSHSIQEGLERLGFKLFNDSSDRLNTVIAFQAPKNIPNSEIIKHLKEDYQVEISGAFGVDILRIGQMGEQCRAENVSRTLDGLNKVLSSLS